MFSVGSSFLPGIFLMHAINYKQQIFPVCLSPVCCLQSREAGVSSPGSRAEEEEKKKLVLYSELGNRQSVHVMER